MLLRPTLAHRASSARISARSSAFSASASGTRDLPTRVGNAGLMSTFIERPQSAEGDRQREPGLARLLVLGVHVLCRLRHRGDGGVEIDSMSGLDLVGGNQVRGPSLDGAEGAPFDARNLYESGNRIAGHSQVMLERRLR